MSLTLLAAPAISFAQEAVSHEFFEEPTEEELQADLDRISELAEKFILGTITPEEEAELRERKTDISDVEAYRDEFQRTGTISQDQDVDDLFDPATDRVDVYQAAPSATPTIFGLTYIVWLAIAVILNMIIVVCILMRQKKAPTVPPQS